MGRKRVKKCSVDGCNNCESNTTKNRCRYSLFRNHDYIDVCSDHFGYEDFTFKSKPGHNLPSKCKFHLGK